MKKQGFIYFHTFTSGKEYIGWDLKILSNPSWNE